MPNFIPNWQFQFFGLDLPKNVISDGKQKKSEPHQSILHIRSSLGAKFQLKLIVLIFWTKSTLKGSPESVTLYLTQKSGDFRPKEKR